MFMDVFKAMFKEEWRMHTAIFSGKSFLFFPAIIALFCFIASLGLPFALQILELDVLMRFTHFFFLFFGVSIGAFGLFGKEIMNRRFGQASLLAYSSRSLPLSEQKIFLAFFLKDIAYYLLLWVIPIFVGFLVAIFFIGFSLLSAFFVCFCLVLSFLLGISLVFALSTIYAHSTKALIGIICGVVCVGILSNMYHFFQVNIFLLAYSLYDSFSWQILAVICTLIVVSSLFSVIFVKVDYPENTKYFKNRLRPLMKRVSSSRYAAFIAKDFIDMVRSEGGIGKIIFSFLLPVAFTYLFLVVFLEIIPTVKVIMIFAVFLGIVSASVYNMLTNIDVFNSYLFLPVKVSTILKSKIQSFFFINSISILVLILAGMGLNQWDVFLPATLLFVSISIYTLAVTVFLTGLNPSVMLYNPSVFLPYVSAISPVLFMCTLLSIFDPIYMLASPLLLPLSYILLKRSFVKWDQWKPYNI